MRPGWGTFLYRLLSLWVQYFLYRIRLPFHLLRIGIVAICSKMSRWPDSDGSDEEDELDCEYDSTWEEEAGDSGGERAGEKKTARSSTTTRSSWRKRNIFAARDMQNYRHGYPVPCSWTNKNKMNLNFYLNNICSSPDGFWIQDFHTKWWGDYERLEYVHSYIQWLFPLQEAGMNYYAYELTKEEIKDFRENEEVMEKLKMSYKLMLDFYGIELVNNLGEVQRARNWKERFKNLNRNTHNNLRITRILKCLGDLGYEQYQAPLVSFFLHETLIKGTLGNVKRSVMDYFIFSIRNKQKRQELLQFAFQHYQPQEEFVWCPRRIQRCLKQKDEQESYTEGEHPHKHADCNPQTSDRSLANVLEPKGGMETSGPSETDMVDKERETVTKPDRSHTESADSESKPAAEEQIHKGIEDKEFVNYTEHSCDTKKETEQNAEKTDEAVSPVSQVGQGLNKLVNLTENSMDGIHHNDDATNCSETDVASQEAVCENTESPKVAGDQVVCHTNSIEDSENQGLTGEVSETYGTLGEQLGSDTVHEEMAKSRITMATEKGSFNAPGVQEGSKSSLDVDGIPTALSDKGDSHSSLSKDEIPRALNEQAEIQSIDNSMEPKPEQEPDKEIR